MHLFRTPPQNIIINTLIANSSSVFVVFFYGFIITLNKEGVGSPFAVIFILPYFLAFGVFFAIAYALPVLALLRMVNFAGPIVALLVGLLPPILFNQFGEDKTFGNALLPFSTVSAVIFCLLAYRRKITQAPGGLP